MMLNQKTACPACTGTIFEKRGEMRVYIPLTDDLTEDGWNDGEIVTDTDNNGNEVIYCVECNSMFTQDELENA